MQLPGESPVEQSTGFRPGFVPRAGNRAAACFCAVASAIRLGRLSAKARLLSVSIILVGITCGGILACCLGSRAGVPPDAGKDLPYWDKTSHVDLKNLTTVGRNPYFNLEPGCRLRYTSGTATRTMTVRRRPRSSTASRPASWRRKKHSRASRRRLFGDTTPSTRPRLLFTASGSTAKSITRGGW